MTHHNLRSAELMNENVSDVEQFGFGISEPEDD